MKKTYIEPNQRVVELSVKRSMLISVSSTQAASDATVYGRENDFDEEY